MCAKNSQIYPQENLAQWGEEERGEIKARNGPQIGSRKKES